MTNDCPLSHASERQRSTIPYCPLSPSDVTNNNRSNGEEESLPEQLAETLSYTDGICHGNDQSSSLVFWTISNPVIVQPYHLNNKIHGHAKDNDNDDELEYKEDDHNSIYIPRESTWSQEASALYDFLSRSRSSSHHHQEQRSVVVLFCLGEALELKTKKEVKKCNTVLLRFLDRLLIDSRD